MQKITCWLLFLALLLGTMPVWAQEAPELPDPGPSLSAQGEMLKEDVLFNDASCDVYGYSFYRGDLSFSFVLMAYEWKLKGLDFSWEKLSSSYTDEHLSVSEWYVISKSGLSAHLHLTGNLLGQSCAVTLYVPEGMGFCLESKQADSPSFYNDAFSSGYSTGTSSFYNDAFSGGYSTGTSSFYNDAFSGGNSTGTSSFYNDVYDGFDEPWTGSYGSDGETICGFCYGSTSCPECYGSGRFRNPYTGSYLECSCGDGKCPVCDGEGVW